MTKKLMFGLLIATFFTSCTIEKRRYLSGYNVQKRTIALDVKSIQEEQDVDPMSPIENATQNQDLSKIKTEKKLVCDASNDLSIDGETENHDLNSIEKRISKRTFPQYAELSLKSKKMLKSFLPPDSCDLVTLKNGQQVSANVIKVDRNDVWYKECDSLDGPTWIMPKTEIVSVVYAASTNKKSLSHNDQTNGVNPGALTPRFTFALLSIVLGGVILALPLSSFFALFGVVFIGLGIVFIIISLGNN